MARFPIVDPKTASPEVRQVFETALKGKEVNLFKSAAVSPAVLRAMAGFFGAVAGGVLSAKEREAVSLVVSEANACGYCIAAHTAIGKGAGLTEAQTLEARRGTNSDPRIAALVKFTLAIHEKKGRVSDADVAAFKGAGYSDAAIAEVVASYALTVFTNYFNLINDTAIDFPIPPAA